MSLRVVVGQEATLILDLNLIATQKKSAPRTFTVAQQMVLGAKPASKTQNVFALAA